MNKIFTRTTTTDLIYSLIIAVSGLVLILATINYYASLGKSEKEFSHKINEKIESLSNVLEDPLWNMDVEEIKRIPQLYFQDEDIYSIVINYRIDSHSLTKREKPGNLFKMKKEIFHLNEKIGDLEMVFSQDKYITSATQQYKETLIIFLITLVILIVIFRYIVKFSIEFPFKDLVFNLEEVAKGKYGQKIPKKKHKDINLIITRFNSMTEQINLRDKELNAAREFLSDIIDSITSIIITTDNHGFITLVNNKAREFFPIGLKNNSNSQFWETITLLSRFKRNWEQVLNGVEISIRREKLIEDEARYFDIFMYPLSGDNVDGVVIRIDEVTEIEKKDEQLRQAQKMETVGFLAGGLAHDFNNVIGGIIGTISLIKYYINKEINIDINKLKQHLITVEDSGKRASDMVQQLLTLAKRHELSLTPLDLNLSLKHVVKICNNTFDKSIDIKVRYYPEPAMIKADLTQIEQVILNVCVNASHAMTIMKSQSQRQGGILEISINKISIDPHFIKLHHDMKPGNYWILKIIDEGIGIPDNIKNKVFDPFFTTKDKDKGTGLGLSMVYNIIKQHDGFVDFYSDLNIGTTFNIYIPVFEEKVESEESLNSDNYFIEKSEGLILIVDDEEIMRRLSEEILKEAGYEVITAKNGKDGVEIYRHNFKLIKGVIMDMAMPVMSGKEAFVEMQKINPDVKVLMASGFKQDDRVKESILRGVRGFISKPFSMNELISSVKKYIG
ncbi:MAG: response regulator [Candidatus Delongbacteria bacterium]|nr:response regulator [Candidatus Delongbacteria bacterium]MBN2835081.1 response regulator [Candidatus Delongbacteria bacterium]